MSELPDALTPGQVALFLTAKAARRACEACGSMEWRLHDEAKEQCTTAVALLKLDNHARHSVKPTVTLICTACGSVRQFVRSVIAQWLQEHRNG